MTYPGILFWLFAILALRSRGPLIYYLFFVCWSLGTLAVVPPQLAAGNLTPAWIAAVILTVRVVLDVGLGRYLEVMLDPRRFGALSLCTIYAAASAFLLPRLFAGQVDVVEIRLTRLGGASPLAPNGANFTQALYFVFTTLLIVDVFFICSDPVKRRQFLSAFGWGAVVAIGTGLLDLAASNLGLSAILEPFRNASYVMMLDNDAMNMHRIVGLMSEASSYASLCLPFLALIALTPSEAGAPWNRWSVRLGLALTVMTYLSTSSSGYVSLAAVGLAVAVNIGVGMVLWRRWAWMAAYVLLILATAGVAVLLFEPQLYDALYHVIDAMVLHKTQSQSYMERSSWNRAAMQAFHGTHWLGVGAGGARASSWPIALLSNIGLPGTALLVIFMAQAFMVRPRAPADVALARATKLAILPNLVMASLSGTTIALGVGVSMLFGLVCAMGWAEPEPERLPAPAPADLEPRYAEPS